MGLLDDAIKDHLTLKAAHGADEGAVKRELDEALGGEQAQSGDPRQEVPEPAEPPQPPSPTPEPTAAQPVASEPVAPEPASDEPFALVEPPPSQPEFTAAGMPDDPAPPTQDESLFNELDEAAPPSTGGDDSGDLLEATPEFFEETPEYDRLWFEEKSPKDFDFGD